MKSILYWHSTLLNLGKFLRSGYIKFHCSDIFEIEDRVTNLLLLIIYLIIKFSNKTVVHMMKSSKHLNLEAVKIVFHIITLL